MARCEDCIYSKMCYWIAVFSEKTPCEHFLSTADVVPKSEVESLIDEIAKTIRGALILVDFSYKHTVKEKQCRKECYEDFLGYIAELKKKYMEGRRE